MSERDGYVLGTTKIVDHGPDNRRWNLVLLGDGYKADQLARFHTHVENFLRELRRTPPFDRLFCGINVYRIDVVSTDSGADEPSACAGSSGAMRRTYFDATYCSVGPGGERLHRLLTINQALALTVARARVPPMFQAIVIVNSDIYGGSGGTVATCSSGGGGERIAIHEIGHSAFGLADEYGGTLGPQATEPGEANVTLDTNRATNKWRSFVLPATPMPSACDSTCRSSACVPPATPPPAGAVGAYEGAYYRNCNVYRPLPRCYMRDFYPFCPVCSGVITATLQRYLPDESITLRTPSLDFRNVPAGMGGAGVTTQRAILFEVVSCRPLTFRVVDGPTGGFGAVPPRSATVSADPILPVASARIWISYTSTNPGDTARGTVRVECVETGQTWTIDLSANTMARPTTAVMLVLDRSGSMSEDAGDAIPKVRKLRDAANAFVTLMQPRDGVGIVRFNELAERLMDVQPAGPAAGGAGRTRALGHIGGSDIDPGGATSIGDGVMEGKRALDDARLSGTPSYDGAAMVVFTDGMWNRPPDLASISGSLTARTFAVGLGLPSNISVPALTALCQGRNGFLLITGMLAGDQPMRLSKYFLQVLAGVTNAQIASDPAGVLDFESEHRIPFRITEADYGMDAIVLSPEPQAIDFELEAPDGSRVTPGSGPAGANVELVTGEVASYYRCALPVFPSVADGSHEGLWHAVLKMGGKATQLKQGLPYEFLVHAYSSLTLDVRLTQKSFDLGALVRVHATLLEYAAPLRGRVWAEITGPDGFAATVKLTGDADGVYTGSYELPLAGAFQFRVRAHGETANGIPFDRERTLTAVSIPGGDKWSPCDMNGGDPDAKPPFSD